VAQYEVNSGERTTILVHYYRAMVGRADIWRTRMDTTTHWAIGATAAIVSFALGNATAPHYVLFIAPLMTSSFLILEARRLTFYHLWQQRVLLLENGLVRPALLAGGTSGAESRAGSGDPDGSDRRRDLASTLDAHLGRTVPTMPLAKAVARRLRRVYLYLFGVQLLAWLLKLANHPEPVPSAAALIERAQIGLLPGAAVLGLGALVAAAGLLLAVLHGGIHREPS
jgi:uncharacterized membrane protein